MSRCCCKSIKFDLRENGILWCRMAPQQHTMLKGQFLSGNRIWNMIYQLIWFFMSNWYSHYIPKKCWLYQSLSFRFWIFGQKSDFQYSVQHQLQTPIFISIFVQNAHSFDSFGYACSYYTHLLVKLNEKWPLMVI